MRFSTRCAWAVLCVGWLTARASAKLVIPTMSPDADLITRQSQLVERAFDVHSRSGLNTRTPIDSAIGLHATIFSGELPLQPEITPGWAVAGVLLLLTGPVLALVGIKKRWLYIALSTAYLASLAVVVLIDYLMVPPISDAIQGAYVIATVGTGVILGGASLTLPDLTESLASIGGGFCLSMWLLTLREGGLVQSQGGMIALVVGLTVASFATYFSSWTQQYGLMVSIALTGSTATVIGIDCFSRAGLKEFWAYLWNLNGNLFPLETTTYPLTKGIRVEQAAVIIIFVAGMASQLKLWKVIRDHRNKKDQVRLAAEQVFQDEEEKVGRDVEEANARERTQWEAVYGNQSDPDRELLSVARSAKSARSMTSSNTTRPRTATQQDGTAVVEHPGERLEATLLAEQLLTKDRKSGVITVHIVSDDEAPEESLATPKPGQLDCDTQFPDDRIPLSTVSEPDMSSIPKKNATTPAPLITALPFNASRAKTEPAESDTLSSHASYTDALDQQRRASTRMSVAQRFSVSSANMLRRVSHYATAPPTIQSEVESGIDMDEVQLSNPTEHDNSQSVVATIDARSLAEMIEDQTEAPEADTPGIMDVGEQPEAIVTQDLMASAEPVVASNVVAFIESPRSDRASVVAAASMADIETSSDETIPSAHTLQSVSRNASSNSSPEAPIAQPSNLNLPAFSPVAQSYRTNEWAKHLGHADVPELEHLRLGHRSAQAQTATSSGDAIAPVNPEQLGQTTANATPRPSITRSKSAVSNISRSTSRSSFRQMPVRLHSVTPSENSAIPSPTPPPPPTTMSATGELSRAPSRTSRRASTSLLARLGKRPVTAIAEEGDEIPRSSSPEQMDVPGAFPASPTPYSSANQSVVSLKRRSVSDLSVYNAASTLLGHRDRLIRHRSIGGLRPVSYQPSIYANHSQLDVAAQELLMSGGDSPSSEENMDDDMPLSQRKQIIRHSRRFSSPLSATSVAHPSTKQSTATSTVMESAAHPPILTSRQSSSTSIQAARSARLLNFRRSVSADLHGSMSPYSTPNMSSNNLNSSSLDLTNNHHHHRQHRSSTPAAAAAAAAFATLPTTRMTSPFAVDHQASHTPDAQREMDIQRSYMITQKANEDQQRNAAVAQQQWAERVAEERMRSEEMGDLHRAALRKMQRRANEADRASSRS